VRHTSAVPVGGDHFTNDLAVACARQFRKRKESSASMLRAFVIVSRRIIRSQIAASAIARRAQFSRAAYDIIEPAPGMLALIRDDLQRAGLDRQIPRDSCSRAAGPS